MRPEQPFTGVSGPSEPEILRNFKKTLFWGLHKKSPKIPDKVKNYPNPQMTLLETFFGFRGSTCSRRSAVVHRFALFGFCNVCIRQNGRVFTFIPSFLPPLLPSYYQWYYHCSTRTTNTATTSSTMGFELEWSLVATSLEGFSVTGHAKGIPEAPFQGIKRVLGAPPGTKNLVQRS